MREPFQIYPMLMCGENARDDLDKIKNGRIPGVPTPSMFFSSSVGIRMSRPVEIDPESFTWPNFGHEPTRSAVLNLEHFLDAVEDKTPGVVVDRGFALETPVLSRAGDGSDFAQILSGRGASGGVLFDNEDQFRFYAR